MDTADYWKVRDAADLALTKRRVAGWVGFAPGRLVSGTLVACQDDHYASTNRPIEPPAGTESPRFDPWVTPGCVSKAEPDDTYT